VACSGLKIQFVPALQRITELRSLLSGIEKPARNQTGFEMENLMTINGLGFLFNFNLCKARVVSNDVFNLTSQQIIIRLLVFAGELIK